MKRYDYMCESVAVVTTALQTRQVFQYINLILTILATIISICYSLYIWHKKALEDKKIDIEEVAELKKIIEDSQKEIERLKNGGQK